MYARCTAQSIFEHSLIATGRDRGARMRSQVATMVTMRTHVGTAVTTRAQAGVAVLMMTRRQQATPISRAVHSRVRRR